MTARVTIAIPIYNGARFLREAIESLLAQSYDDFTLLGIDDASTDDSVAIASSFDRVRVVRNPARLGLAANWNRAIGLCESEYLVIAHQDDVYSPRYLERMAAVIDAHPRAFAAHCKSATTDDPATRFKDRFWPRGAGVVEREPAEELAILRQGNYVIAPSVILRRSALPGLFDTRYEFVVDWDFWLRGLSAGRTLVGVNERLVSFRRHEETATLASERTMRRYEEELELLGDTGPYRALERNLLADFVRRLAAGDRAGARALLAFGTERVPCFERTAAARLMRAALPGGRAAGTALRLMQAIYVRIIGR